MTELGSEAEPTKSDEVNEMTDIHHLSTPRDRREELLEDLAKGFAQDPPRLPAKYFYDARGSELFEQITTLDEYYPTRAETEILLARADEIVAAVDAHVMLELGSGSSTKTVALLEAMHRAHGDVHYLAFDVSPSAIAHADAVLRRDRDWLRVTGVVGDFNSDLHLLSGHGRRLVAFLGSTIGNLAPAGRAGLFAEIRASLNDDEALVLGADLVKDPDVLVAAYDDARGVTAAFNLNLLTVLQREVGAVLEPDAWRHEARWNATEERIEMWLVAVRDTAVVVADAEVDRAFVVGEGILTELSCKFRRDGITAELAAAGLVVDRWYTDAAARFALLVARPG